MQRDGTSANDSPRSDKLRPGGDWQPVFEASSSPDSSDLDVSGTQAASRAHSEAILTAADHCSAVNNQMENFAGGRRRAALLAHPAFTALVQDFALHFVELTALVDAVDCGRVPGFGKGSWRSLIADSRLIKALEAGIAREREIVRARALQRWMEEQAANRG